MDTVGPPKVSVIIPYYKASAFVAAAVESVLAQTVDVHEVIVVDDGSPDDAATALAAITDPRLRVVRILNGGTAHARNLGCGLATGDVLAFIDADDTWYPTKLERQLPLFRGDDPPVAVGAQMHHIGSRGSPVGITGVAEVDDEAQRLVRTAELMPFAISSAVVTRAAYQTVGGFDETLQLVEDLDFMARVAALGAIRTVNEPLGGYRMHPGSGSARSFRLQRQGMRFVHARMLAREAGRDLSMPQFLASRTKTKRDWFDDTARSLYRSAGVLAAEGRYVRASMRLGASVAMNPKYAIPRLRQQHVVAHLRNGGDAAD